MFKFKITPDRHNAIQNLNYYDLPDPRHFSLPSTFKEPRNPFSAWRDGTASLFVVPFRHATHAGGIDSSKLIPGLYKLLQIRALLS
jgi:hypothetical protein